MAVNITKDLLRKAINPLAKTNEHVEEILEAFYTLFPKYEINTEKRIAAFLAQAAHETGGFKLFTEIGDKDYFDKYEPSTKIGKELGNTQPGDGYKYRGRGIFQLTGRSNYKRYSEKLSGIDLVEKPELAAEPRIACHIAAEFWKQNNLNSLADEGDVRAITKHIEGGEHDASKRTETYQLALKTIEQSVI